MQTDEITDLRSFRESDSSRGKKKKEVTTHYNLVEETVCANELQIIFKQTLTDKKNNSHR